MKCQILFSGKNKENIINLSTAEFAQTGVKVKEIKAAPLEILYLKTCFQQSEEWLPISSAVVIMASILRT